MPEAQFIVQFHSLDGNGRVPRDAFFAALATHLFRNCHAQTIKAHFESIAWVKPALFDGTIDLLQSIRTRGWRIGIITKGSVPSQTAKIRNSGLSERIDGFVISAAFGL